MSNAYSIFFQVSIHMDWFQSIGNVSNLTIIRDTNSSECKLARFAGSLLLIISILSFIINIRAIFFTIKTRHSSRRDTGLVIGMFISSLSVIMISVPSVVIQCFLCRRLLISIVCRIEGFNSFFNGCSAIYLLVTLSCVRYATTANSSISIQFQRQLQQYSSYLALVCFLMGGVWAIPPIFGHMSAYVPEGLGFHCGLDWFDRSLAGRIYFFLLFLSVFFLPLSIVIYINIYIQRTVYRLTHLQPSILLESYAVQQENHMRRHISSTLFDKEIRRLHRLHDDRCFVVATGISVIVYLIAWTPYSIVAIAQVFGDQFSLHNPWLMTTCAVLAKLSMITNPIVYTIILQSQNAVKKKNEQLKNMCLSNVVL
jgi:hypothetical protein